MKLRHPLAIRLAALGLSVLLRVWMATLRIREHPLRPGVTPWNHERRRVFVIWHEALVMGAGRFAKSGVSALISQHRDGELIAQVMKYLGGGTIRGSSTRGGDRAVRDMLERSGETHLAITPDGPRGPRRKLQEGVIYLAARGEIEIAPCGIGAGRAWRARSWDRMLLPKPFTRVDIVFGEPMVVPADVSREEFEAYRVECEKRLNGVQEMAEAIAEGRVEAPRGQ